MSKPFLMSLTAVTLAAVSYPAAAAPDAHVHLAAAKVKSHPVAARHAKPRTFTSSVRAGSGVWRCTWPTSGGGCLVWEKTACKIINPF